MTDMKKTLPLNKKQRRQQIVDSALKVFSNVGYHDAHMEDIAFQAGIGKGTLYEYFSSKEELFKESVVTSIEAYSDILKTIYPQGKNLRQRIELLVEVHLRFCQERKSWLKLLMMNMHCFDEDLQRHIGNLHREIKNFIQKAVRESGLSNAGQAEDISLLSVMIMGVINSANIIMLYEYEDIDIGVLQRKLTGFIMNAIKQEVHVDMT